MAPAASHPGLVFVGAALDGEFRVLEEAVVLHEGRSREVDEHTDAAVLGGFEDAAEETFERERGEGPFGGVEGEIFQRETH
jgi:hypothetical protein